MAVNYFLKLDGIPGESQDSKHKDEIDVASFSWGAANVSSRSGGTVSVQDIQVSKYVDKSSPILMSSCATGKHIATAVLTCRKAGGGGSSAGSEFLVIKLSDVLVTGYAPGANPTDTGFSALAGNGPTADSISLNFTKIEMDYTASDGTTVSGTIDLTTIG